MIRFSWRILISLTYSIMQKKQGFGIDVLRMWGAQAGFNVGVNISDSVLSDLSDKLFKVRFYWRVVKVLQLQMRKLDFSSERPWGFSSDVWTILIQRMPSWILRSSNRCTKMIDTCFISCTALEKRWVTSQTYLNLSSCYFTKVDFCDVYCGRWQNPTRISTFPELSESRTASMPQMSQLSISTC